MLNMSPIAGFLYLYLFIGLLFSIAFAFWGAKRLDTGMKQASWGIKLLLIPGGIALWPILLRKWFLLKK